MNPNKAYAVADLIRVWGPTAAWATVLYIISTFSGFGGGPSFPFADKFAHLVLYGVLGATLAWGRARSPRVVSHTLVLVAGALYGVTDEWHQMHVPGRTPELADWVADVAGLLFGYRMMLRVVERESGNLEAEETV